MFADLQHHKSTHMCSGFYSRLCPCMPYNCALLARVFLRLRGVGPYNVCMEHDPVLSGGLRNSWSVSLDEMARDFE